MKTSAFRPSLIAAVSLVSLLVMSGCSSARIQETWTDPSVKTLSYQRLFVNVTGGADVNRSAAETAIGQALPATAIVASHTVLAAGATLAEMKQAVAASHSDGLAIIRVVSDQEVRTTVPGEPTPTYPSTIDAYWGRTQLVTPEIPSNNRVLIINVGLYDVASGKLQWSGTLESINPSSATDLGGEIAKAVAAKLRRQGLVK